MNHTDTTDAKTLIIDGIDIDTSDLTWEVIDKQTWKLTTGGMRNFTEKDFDLSPNAKVQQLPSWSTEALVDMLPKHIRIIAPYKLFTYELVILPDKNYLMGYKDTEDKESDSWLEKADNGSMFQNALTLVKWALRYRYIGIHQLEACKNAIS